MKYFIAVCNSYWKKANALRHLDISWEEYLAKMKRSYEWADELVIICMAIFLGKDILQILHNTKQENPWNTIPGKIDGWPTQVKEPRSSPHGKY